MEITYIQPPIDENHLDVLWYGGRVAEIERKGYTFILGAYGDVRATLLDQKDNEIAEVRDKCNSGAFYGEMNRLIKDDIELHIYESWDPKAQYQLVLENNNWWEVLIDAPDGETFDTGWVCNSDNYHEALQEIIVNMDSVIKELNEAA